MSRRGIYPGDMAVILRDPDVQRRYREIRDRYGDHASLFPSAASYIADLAAEANAIAALLGPRWWRLPGFETFERLAELQRLVGPAA